jgi:D-alanine-D-alanine ligase
MGFQTQVVDADRFVPGDSTSFDAAILALHGTRGGSGEVQATLSRMGIPHSGPPTGTVTLAFDKVRSRQLLAYHNLPVPAAIALARDRRVDDRAIDLLGWPCVVKPRRGALGAGVTRLDTHAEVARAVERALEVDEELVLERYVDGPELQVVMLEDRVLGIMEIHRALDGRPVAMECPGRLTRSRRSGVENLARSAVTALGVDRGISRVDLLLSPRSNEVILEVEPLPPLHRAGVVARVAAAAGISHEGLIADMVRRVLAEVRVSEGVGAVALQ